MCVSSSETVREEGGGGDGFWEGGRGVCVCGCASTERVTERGQECEPGTLGSLQVWSRVCVCLPPLSQSVPAVKAGYGL